MTKNTAANRIEISYYYNPEGEKVANIVIKQDDQTGDFYLGYDLTTAAAILMIVSDKTGYPVYRVSSEFTALVIGCPIVLPSYRPYLVEVDKLTVKLQVARERLEYFDADPILTESLYSNRYELRQGYLDLIDQLSTEREIAVMGLAAAIKADSL